MCGFLKEITLWVTMSRQNILQWKEDIQRQQFNKCKLDFVCRPIIHRYFGKSLSKKITMVQRQPGPFVRL